MIIGLHHVQITIPTGMETEAKNFYCNVLGLSEIEKPEALQGRGGFWLKAGDREIHVGVEEGFDRTKTKAHVAYQVLDIDYWRNVIKQNNVEIVEAIALPNHKRFEFRDPFGNRVELTQVVQHEEESNN